MEILSTFLRTVLLQDTLRRLHLHLCAMQSIQYVLKEDVSVRPGQIARSMPIGCARFAM